MNRHIYSFIDNNINFHIDFVAKLEESLLRELYFPGWKLAVDETMCPTKSSKNPHHMYVPNKPHPNGILFTSVADENLLMLSLKIRRRVLEDPDIFVNRTKDEMAFNRTNYTPVPKKRTHELVEELYDYPEGSLVIVDKLYGGMNLLMNLAKRRVFMIGSCRSDRPSFLFKEFYIHLLINQFSA